MSERGSASGRSTPSAWQRASSIGRYFGAVLVAGLLVWSLAHVLIRSVERGTLEAASTKLTVLHWGSPEEARIVRTLIEAFERANPDVQVQQIHANEYDTKLKTMLAAGTPPDLFYLRPEDLPNFATMNLVLPIDEPLAAAGMGPGSSYFNDLYPILVRTFQFDGERAGSGPLYGIPKDFTTLVLYVNLNLFEQAGVAVPYGGWTWDDYQRVLPRFRSLPVVDGKEVFGGALESWALVLRTIFWGHGADFFHTDGQGQPDFTRLAFDTPAATRALERFRTMRFRERSLYRVAGTQDDTRDSFIQGRLATYGPVGRWLTPDARKIERFRWDVVPVPSETGRNESAIATVAWAISRQTRHPDKAFELLTFLCGYEGQRMQAELGLAIPSLRSVAESEAFHKDGDRPANSKLFLSLVEDARLAPLPRLNQQFDRAMGQHLSRIIRTNEQVDGAPISTEQVNREMQQQWTADQENPLLSLDYPPMPWRMIGVMAAVLLGSIAVLGLLAARRQRLGPIEAAQQRSGYLFISPWILGFLLFVLGPMILSLILSFSRWTAMTPFSEARFVGLDNYRELFAGDPLIGPSLWVTTYYAILSVPLCQVAGLAVALLMNNAVRGITVFRTVYFVPSVITGVAMATLWLQLFDERYGLINAVLSVPLSLFSVSAPSWFDADAQYFAVPAFVIMSLWGVGAGMVIYLAGLKGIPESLYEAALIDGAGPMGRLFNITLPMLSPLIFFNLVMGLIGSFQVFVQAYVMTGGGPDNKTLFYVLYLYRQAFEYHNMGYASAMAWLLFVILLGLTILVFRGSRGLVYYEGLKQ